MPRPEHRDDSLLDAIADVFREHGFEGASLSRLSETTGLQRASLYHRFPEGKEQMAVAVLERVAERFANHVLAPLAAEGDLRARVRSAARRLGEFYREGRGSCLLESLSLGDASDERRAALAGTTRGLIEALAGAAREAGSSPARARARATEAVVRLEGSLVIARATGDTRPFREVLRGLPEALLGEA